MHVYITDDGHLLDATDFIPYVLWLIKEYKAENEQWDLILTAEFWGEQLIVPGILNEIKERVK